MRRDIHWVNCKWKPVWGLVLCRLDFLNTGGALGISVLTGSEDTLLLLQSRAALVICSSVFRVRGVWTLSQNFVQVEYMKHFHLCLYFECFFLLSFTHIFLSVLFLPSPTCTFLAIHFLPLFLLMTDQKETLQNYSLWHEFDLGVFLSVHEKEFEPLKTGDQSVVQLYQRPIWIRHQSCQNFYKHIIIYLNASVPSDFIMTFFLSCLLSLRVAMHYRMQQNQMCPCFSIEYHLRWAKNCSCVRSCPIFS